MAYALGFPKDVTDNIYSMRDWCWEMVRDGGKTPSAKCFDAWEYAFLTIPNRDRCWIAGGECESYAAAYDSEDEEWFCYTQFVPAVRTNIEVNDPYKRVYRKKYRLQRNRKLKRLQENIDTSTRNLWWQCEPCQQ